jgi:hypothetical protein
MPTLIQRSLAGGEIAPALYGRADQAKYQTGLRRCRDYMVQKYGGVTNRAGTQYVCEVKDSTKTTALLDFIFDEDNSYVIEAGDGYMRFVRNATQINISAPAAYNGGTTYAIADLVSYSGVNYYSIANGNVGNQPDISPTWWYPLTGTIYEIPSPYPEADVMGLNFSQSGDVIVIAHQNHPPYELKRFGETNWTLTPMPLVPDTNRPRTLAVAKGGAGANTYRYRVTAINKFDGEQSLVGTEALTTITGATQANPVVVTDVAHPYANGDEVLIEGIVGMDELNGRTFLIDNIAGNTYELVDEDGTGYDAYVSGGTAGRISGVATAAAAPTAGAPHVLTWNAVTDALKYLVYKEIDGEYGFIGVATAISAGVVTFNDTGLTPDTAISHPLDLEAFRKAGDFPKTVEFSQQQRLAFANSVNEPEAVWMSQTGRFHNFTTEQPLAEDSAIKFTAAGRSVREVLHLLDLGRFVLLSSGVESALLGDGSGFVTHDQINNQAQTYHGSADVSPITIGNNALFVQARGRVVRDLQFSFQSDGYQGRDLSVFAPHFFSELGQSISRWAYQQNPHSILWAVQPEGDMLGLTYLPEHEVWGWHKHNTGGDRGTFLDVRVIPESYTPVDQTIAIKEDYVYVLVERDLSGVAFAPVRYIERMESRDLADTLDSEIKFLDSHLGYNGTNLTLNGYDANAVMTLSGGVNWDQYETLTLTAGVNTFAASDIGNGVWLYLDDESVFVVIEGYTNPAVVTVRPVKTVPVSMRAIALRNWGLAVDKVAGLDHLEGEEVGITADGFVEPVKTVASGEVTLSRPFVIIYVGLAYVPEIETLDPENPGGETIIDKDKRIRGVTILVEHTSGLWAGPDRDHMVELKQRSVAVGYDPPVPRETGPVELVLESTWNEDGRTVMQQRDPLPSTILSIAPLGFVGE